MDNSVNIVFITDNNYIMQTYIAILSIKDNGMSDVNYQINIIAMDVDNKNTEKLISLSDANFRINIITKSKKEIENLSNEYVKNYSPAIFYKLKLDEIFIDYDKMLFLDSDIIINNDLAELYNTDISDCYIAGCKDIFPTVEHLIENRKLYKKYFNVGVMLLNLKLIREDEFFKKSIQYFVKEGEYFKYPEQDTLNNLIGDKIKCLLPKYNYLTSNKYYTKNQLEKFYSNNLEKEKNIVIFHYAGFKPWEYNPVFYGKYWEKYYKKSPFYDKKLKRNKKYNFFIRLCAFVKNQIRIIKNKELYQKVGII